MGKSKREKTSIFKWCIFILALGVFLYSGYKLFLIQKTYREGKEEYQKLEKFVTVDDDKDYDSLDDKKGNELEQYPKVPQVDFKKLKSINNEIIGWISIEGIGVNYPIVQTTDNEYYLHNTFERKSNIAGSIFLEAQNSSLFDNPNSIVYGHNMKNGTMFGSLKELRKQETYDKNKYMWLVTEGKNYLYEIFSVFETPVNSDVYTLFHEGDVTFKEYLHNMKALSEIDNDIAVEEQDKIIILSTCTANSKTRFVAFCKRILEV